MKLSKKEARYRMKIIQENRYNKEEQRILDKAAAEMPRRYEDIYEAQRGGAVYWFMAIIGSMRASRALASAGNSFTELSGAFDEFRKTVREISSTKDLQMAKSGEKN